MSDVVPEGFALADLGAGFGKRFGKVYFDRVGRRLGFRVADDQANASGNCHGGAMATFADTQLLAIQGGPEEGLPHNSTISLSLDYLAPVPIGAWVEAAVTLVKRTRTMVFTQAIMTVEGRPVARATAIYKNPRETGT